LSQQAPLIVAVTVTLYPCSTSLAAPSRKRMVWPAVMVATTVVLVVKGLAQLISVPQALKSASDGVPAPLVAVELKE